MRLAKNPSHSFEKLFFIHGLCDISVALGVLKAFELEILLKLDCKHHNRDVLQIFICLNGLCNLPAIHLRHHDIEKYEIRLFHFHKLKRLPAVVCLYRLKTFFFQYLSNNERKLWLIINKHYLGHLQNPS
ncbi:hypothetical protein BMS3Bbin16_00040 [archaeon BMS3Bbin16]|nr:hypothetical protein BMS3Bbin16_00040 [archaeon BMS3Bbin16]